MRQRHGRVTIDVTLLASVAETYATRWWSVDTGHPSALTPALVEQ
jgi:hypothetical protein